MQRLFPLILITYAAFGVSCLDTDESSSSAGGVNQCAQSDVAYESYASGLTGSGEQGHFKIELLDAMPAPPGRGSNGWTIKITDEAGQALPSATIDKVFPFMPAHGHSTGVTPVIGDVDAEGKATVDDIDFMMAGVWTVTFTVSDGTTSDEIVFAFCIDG